MLRSDRARVTGAWSQGPPSSRDLRWRNPEERSGRRVRLVATGLALLLAVVTSAAAMSDEVKSLGLQQPQETVEAPDFTLRDLNGKKVQMRDFRGKVVFLNFFATWCVPCRLEMPAMDRLYQANKDKGLLVLAVDLREGVKPVRSFLRELKVSFPALLDEDGSVAFMYGVRPLPTTYLVGRDGKLLWRAYGAREWDSPEARQYFARVLADGKR